jgi:tRNA(Ile)-lysidine synthase
VGRAFRHDATNDDPRIPRNRVRLVLVPLLEREFNPRIVDILADAADVAREEWRWLRAAAEELLAVSSEPDPAGWRVDARTIGQAPVAVARVALRLLMERASGGRFIALRHVTAALDLCAKDRGQVDVPGIRLERVGAKVVLRSRRPESRGRPAGYAANFFVSPLSIPGETAIAQAGCTVSAEVAPSAAGLERGLLGRGDMAVVPRSCCTGMLTVRSRRPGDRLKLPGLEGHKKLQDLFVDRKVPRPLRDLIPIVVDDRDRIVWVAGHTIAGEFRVTNPAQAVIILRLKLWGGSA